MATVGRSRRRPRPGAGLDPPGRRSLAAASALTAVALVPLDLWFIVGAVSLSGAGYDGGRAWLAAPVQHHRDAAPDPGRCSGMPSWACRSSSRTMSITRRPSSPSLMATIFAAVALGLACAVAVLKVSLGS